MVDQTSDASGGDNDSSPPADSSSSQLQLSRPPISRFVIKATSIASLGGIIFGYDMGVVSGALPQLKSTFNLSKNQQEMVVSFLYLGGGVGAAVGGTLTDTTGRRQAILLTDVIFALGGALLFWAVGLPEILLGRIVVGFGVSVSGIADVAYLTEISPREWRGALVSVNEACISLGFLLAYCASYGFTLVEPEDGWRFMFGLGIVIAGAQFLGMLGMPESPVWLNEMGRTVEAHAALHIIHDESSEDGGCVSAANDAAREGDCSRQLSLDATENKYVAPTLHRESHGLGEPPTTTCSQKTDYSSISSDSLMIESAPSLHGSSSRLKRFLLGISTELHQIFHEVETHYRQAIIAVFLSIAQQFCGHPNVLNYAPEIFHQIGLGSKRSVLSTVLIGVLKFSVTCFVIWKIEFIGRRFLLLIGIGTIAASLFLLSIAFWGVDDEEQMALDNAAMACVGVFGVAVGYAASFAPLTWLLTSEMFPPNIRGRALGASSIITYLSASLVSYTFLSAQSALGASMPFLIYCIISTASLGFAALAIPDTGGKSPEEIEEAIQEMWWWRSGKERRKHGSATDLFHESGLS